MTAQSGVVSWSQTSNSNASADSNVNWAENQAPSSVNDSARAMMSSAAKYRDDISGAIATGGSSTAFTVASNQSFSTLAYLANQIVAFSPHTTCGATVTLNVDSLGAKPLRSAPSTELPAGALVQGTPYVATYNSSDGAFYLHGFYGNVYGIPIGGMIDFTGTTAPNSSFVLPFGQAINRTTYATYFAMVSTTYGTGDGSTTFNVPDLRGRVAVGKDDMGGSAASRLTGTSITTGGATTLGGSGGGETKTLLTANLPAYTPSGTIALNSNGTPPNAIGAGYTPTNAVLGSGFQTIATSQIFNITGTFTGTAQGGTSTPVAVVQPSLILNKILRVV